MFHLQKISPTKIFHQCFVHSIIFHAGQFQYQKPSLKSAEMHMAIYIGVIFEACLLFNAHIPLDEGKLKFWPVRLRLHNLHVNLDCLQNTVWKATVHLFNLLLLIIYIPFSTSLFCFCQIYRSFYAISVRGKRAIQTISDKLTESIQK